MSQQLGLVIQVQAVSTTCYNREGCMPLPIQQLQFSAFQDGNAQRPYFCNNIMFFKKNLCISFLSYQVMCIENPSG